MDLSGPWTLTTSKENGIDKIQTWTYEKSDAIKVDARKGHRFKPKLNAQPNQYDTPLKFFLNVCLPPDFVNGFVGFANTNGPLGTMHCDAVHKSLTYGEAVKFFLYILTICLYPGDALDELWGETFGEDDIVSPLGLGRWGISKNRFKLLIGLMGKLHPLSEFEADTANTDPWRFSDFWLRCFNQWMPKILVPGWLFGPDEGMSAWDALAGDTPTDIPHLSFEPRKPKNTGAEVTMMMEGTCGMCIKGEVLKGAATNPHLKYADDWSYTCAMHLRLADDWLPDDVLRPNEPEAERVYGADSHFMGVDEVEYLLIEVSTAGHICVHTALHICVCPHFNR